LQFSVEIVLLLLCTE